MADTYRIGGLVGQGGMGAVFHAVDVRDNRPVAVKWVLPDRDRGRSRERLLREAALTRRVEHPNVVRVYEVGEERGSIFLVMELLQGESLESWVLRSPCVPQMAAQLMFPVMRGVEAAHHAGVVHRDLKPHNVILCRETAGLRPTVIDFGISRGDGLDGDLTLTQTGMMVGTPLYMAPEQLAGHEEADLRTDVYALGVMLFELLSGGSPYESEKYAPLLSEKLSRRAIRLSAYLPDVDPALERVLVRALERNPDKRYQTVAELGAALEPFASGARFSEQDPLYRGPSPAGGDSKTLKVRRTARRKPRRRWPFVLAFAAVTLGGLGVGLWLAPDEELAVTELPREPSPPVAASAETHREAEASPPPEARPPIPAAEAPGAAEEPEGDPTPPSALAPEPVTPAAAPPARRRRRARARGARRGVGRSGRLSADDF